MSELIFDLIQHVIDNNIKYKMSDISEVIAALVVILKDQPAIKKPLSNLTVLESIKPKRKSDKHPDVANNLTYELLRQYFNHNNMKFKDMTTKDLYDTFNHFLNTKNIKYSGSMRSFANCLALAIQIPSYNLTRTRDSKFDPYKYTLEK